MAGKDFGTMFMGYHYDEGKKVGYSVVVGSLSFQNVSYHSKGQLIDQLVHSGYKKEDIEVQKVNWLS